MHKTAKKLIKDVKGEISLKNMISYLQKTGYAVIFYTEDKDNNLLIKYNLTKHSKTVKAFTFISKDFKGVFINDDAPLENKLYSVLHEIGHIVMKHLSQKQTSNDRFIEMEADAFAYEVLNYKSNSKTIIIMLLTALLSFGTGIAIPKINIAQSSAAVINTVTTSEHIRSSMPVVPDETMTEPQALTDESVTDIVYVTPSGERYHKADCRYVKGKNCTELTKTKAKTNYTPCKVCNP